MDNWILKQGRTNILEHSTQIKHMFVGKEGEDINSKIFVGTCYILRKTKKSMQIKERLLSQIKEDRTKGYNKLGKFNGKKGKSNLSWQWFLKIWHQKVKPQKQK